MNSIKQRTELAKSLINPERKIVMRKVLSNGNIAERILTPIMHSNTASDVLYNDTMIVYRSKYDSNKIDINNIDYTKLTKIAKKNLQTTTTAQGVILYRIETLLECGYTVIQ